MSSNIFDKKTVFKITVKETASDPVLTVTFVKGDGSYEGGPKMEFFTGTEGMLSSGIVAITWHDNDYQGNSSLKLKCF